MPRRSLASFVIALLLAAPAAAFADGGAGDNQYQDPLAAPAPTKKVTKKKAATAPAANTPAASAPAATPAPATAGASASSGASTSPAPAASASPQQLPRTGFPAGVVAMAGVALIAAGLLLRRRTVTQ